MKKVLTIPKRYAIIKPSQATPARRNGRETENGEKPNGVIKCMLPPTDGESYSHHKPIETEKTQHW